MRLFSDTAEYALRAVVWLAGRPEECATAQQIATATKTPPGYLAKVLQTLARAGILRAQRGLGGGFSLTRPPDAITVLDLINAVDPFGRIETCPLGLPSHGTVLCPMHRRIDEAIAQVEAAFAGTTVADIIDEPASSQPLVDRPA